MSSRPRAGPDAPFPQRAVPIPHGPRRHPHQAGAHRVGLCAGRRIGGRVQLDNIYFARSADPNAPKWQVFDRRDHYGDMDTDFKDVVLHSIPRAVSSFWQNTPSSTSQSTTTRMLSRRLPGGPTNWATHRRLWPSPVLRRIGKYGAAEGQAEDQGGRRRATDRPRPQSGRRARRRCDRQARQAQGRRGHPVGPRLARRDRQAHRALGHSAGRPRVRQR